MKVTFGPVNNSKDCISCEWCIYSEKTNTIYCADRNEEWPYGVKIKKCYNYELENRKYEKL